MFFLPELHKSDFGALGTDDVFGQTVHLAVAAVFQLDFRHFHRTLMVREHAGGKSGVGVLQVNTFHHIVVHAHHGGMVFVSMDGRVVSRGRCGMHGVGVVFVRSRCGVCQCGGGEECGEQQGFHGVFLERVVQQAKWRL